MTAGTMFLMWLGEQIDEFGIGNGISLLIMAGILARMPGAGYDLLQQASFDLSGSGGKLGIAGLIVLAAMFVAVVTGAVRVCTEASEEPEEWATAARCVARTSVGRLGTARLGLGSAAIRTTVVGAAGGAAARSPNAPLP